VSYLVPTKLKHWHVLVFRAFIEALTFVLPEGVVLAVELNLMRFWAAESLK
jgi:hypothetical protein